MSPLDVAILVVWIAFWLYWLAAAATATRGTRPARTRPVGLLIVIVGVAVVRLLRAPHHAIHSPALEVIGSGIFLSGLALAVWARRHIGRNWGMPMTRKEEPELVTTGPYRVIRHPIYSGILLAMIGTAVAVNLYWLLIFAIMAAYFIYSAVMEERLLSSAMPDAYPEYRARTKMLIPFLL